MPSPVRFLQRHRAPTVALALVVATHAVAAQRQVIRLGGGANAHADPAFTAAVAAPAYTAAHPKVLLDEAHREANTMTGPYSPFSDLLKADGYLVSANGAFFDADALQGVSVLVIPNARSGDDPEAAGMPALAPDEVEAVATWVRNGGSLLLLGDEAAFGDAAATLAATLGVTLSGGRAFDSTAYDTTGESRGNLAFSDANHLLGDHPILQGRSAGERVHRVVFFGGESMTGPAGSVTLLALSDHALEIPPTSAAEMKAKMAAAMANAQSNGGMVQVRMEPPKARSAAGKAAGLAFELGKGRVVVLGDAAMLSAQVLAMPDGRSVTVGMGVPGNDDQRFALNVMHWLSRLY